MKIKQEVQVRILDAGVLECVSMLIAVGPIIAGIAIVWYAKKRDRANAVSRFADAAVVRDEGAGQMRATVAVPREMGDVSESARVLEAQKEIFLANHPALRKWRTSVALSILGVLISWLGRTLLAIAGMAAGLIVVSLIPGLYGGDYLVRVMVVALVAILNVCSIAYAVFIYPSYFTRLPLLESPLTISMFNFLFGGIICGALWNSCLTISREEARKKKGVSYIIYALFEGQIVLIQLIGCAYLVVMFAAANVPVA